MCFVQCRSKTKLFFNEAFIFINIIMNDINDRLIKKNRYVDPYLIESEFFAWLKIEKLLQRN